MVNFWREGDKMQVALAETGTYDKQQPDQKAKVLVVDVN
jgi:hypothetical protein